MIIIILFTLIGIVYNLNSNSYNQNNTVVTDNTLKSNDFEFKRLPDEITVVSIYYEITPKVDIEYIKYKIYIYDSDGSIINEATETKYDLDKNQSYKYRVEVGFVNYLKTEAANGRQIFFDIYSNEEKAADPSKKDTGLFFFKGKEGYPFAVCNAGGGFAYVGAIHDSFPHALELSKKGYNAFALIYRPGAQSAVEDLARAISFIFNNADKFKISTSCYSVWGGSAGARMAAWLGSYGPYAFGGATLPRPGAVIMQYTGHDEYTKNDPPTFACVGENDGIADWRIMQMRINALKKLNIDTEFHHYKELRHGFGLGTHTIAENWLNEAV